MHASSIYHLDESTIHVCRAETELLVRARTPLRAHVDDSTVSVRASGMRAHATSPAWLAASQPVSRIGPGDGAPYRRHATCVYYVYRHHCSDDGVDRERLNTQRARPVRRLLFFLHSRQNSGKGHEFLTG